MFKSKSLVFVGNYGNRNIGDDAIFQVLSARYKDSYPDYVQYVFVRHYSQDIRKLSIANPLKLDLSSIYRVLTSMDIIVIGGGGIFSAYTGPIAKLIPVFAILCKFLRKTVIYESVGVYTTAGVIQRYLLYLSMILSKQVTVRDKSSVECLKNIQRFKKIVLVKDPGTELKPVSKKETKRIFINENITLLGKTIGFSIKQVHNSKITESLAKKIIETINVLAKNNINVILIPFCHDKLQCTEQDHLFAERIYEEITNKEKVFTVKKYYLPGEIMGIMSQCDAFIGMRFHSLVFAHSLKIPLIPISYEVKCLDFIKENNYRYFGIDNIKNINLSDEIIHLLNR